jgi:hypothetical protein
MPHHSVPESSKKIKNDQEKEKDASQDVSKG